MDKLKKTQRSLIKQILLTRQMFKDLQPRQPSDKIFGEQFIKMAASEIGLLRGYMSPDEKGGNPKIRLFTGILG